MITNKISQQGRARILIHEGYNFKGKVNVDENIIANCIISRDCNIESLYKHIYEHLYMKTESKMSALRALSAFVKKYNLKKYYKKVVERYRSCDEHDYMKIVRHFYNYKHVPVNIFTMEYSHYGERTRSAGKLLSDSLFTSIANAISDVMIDSNDYQIGRVMICYLERANRFYFNKDNDRAFTIKKDGMMRFTPKKAPLYMTDTQWSSYKRSDVKYGKGLRKIFDPIINIIQDVHIEKLANSLKSKYVFAYKFKRVSGKDIKKYYFHENQSADAATLSSSCMRHKSCQSYFDIYVHNPEDIEMLIAVDENDIVHGRALLWNKIIPHNKEAYPDEIQVMDRIYGKDITIQAFKKYAANNNMWHKHQQNYSDAALVSPVGQTITGYKTRQLTIESNEYPYMDTLKYTNDDPEYTDKIVLNSVDGDTIFDSTDGCYNSEESVTDYHGNRINADTACWDEYNDEHYHPDDAVWCEADNTYALEEDAIEISGQYFHPNSDKVVYSNYEQEYLEEENALYSEYEDSYIPCEDAVECEISGWLHVDNSKTIILVVDGSDSEYTVSKETTIEELREHIS